MIIREKYIAPIRDFYDSDLIKVITGIRRCGKSVILGQIEDEIRQKSDRVISLNFEDRIVRRKIHNGDELIDYIDENKDDQLWYVFLDEVQNLPDWNEACKTLRLHGCSLFITGSNSKLLSREFTKELSGRYVSFRVHPFVYQELIEYAAQLNKEITITDYLIWLVDIQKGTITIEDLNFIRNLHLSSKVLFVFTRADKRPDEEIKKVLVEAKTTIEESGIDYYAITAFSSHNNKEYFGDYIQSFLKDVVKNKTGENDITEQINLLANDIRKKIVKEKYNSNKRKTNYYEVLSNTRNITSIKSVALLWKHENIRIMQIEKAYDLLKDIVKELQQVIEKH